MKRDEMLLIIVVGAAILLASLAITTVAEAYFGYKTMQPDLFQTMTGEIK